MFKKAMTTEQRLERNIFQLMQSERYQCMAQIIMIGDKEVDENHPTACTNGRDEKYGRKFMDKCDDAEQKEDNVVASSMRTSTRCISTSRYMRSCGRSIHG